ncbi:MAG TPA: DUF3168 domain-containing protein [Caulobacterales bacterium]|nr:DUF3168 domain-containing protein [Caulobacterales bacterium]
MSADRALVAALRAAAMADAGVTALLGDPARFYDDPPPDPVFPYATLGRVESKPAEASGVEATEHAVTLHVWSRYGGRAEAVDAIAALRAALHDQPISVEGRRLVLLLATFSDIFRSGDGRTTHGVLRLRAITEAA